MKFNSSYHPKSFLPKLIMGKVFYGLFKTPYKKGDLLVLNYHSTPEWLMAEFENQVRFFSEHFNIVSPDWLETFYEGGNAAPVNDKPSVLFTFDDGLKNNKHAALVLEKYNARGIFFLVPEFYGSPADIQQDYYLKNIRNQVNYNIDTGTSDVTALSVDEISTLLRSGHRVGCHSLTHTMNRNDDAIKQVSEIVKSKELLEKQFNIPVVDFCAPFDSLRSTSKDQMKLIRENYKFFHATFPGSNSVLPDPFFIRRTNVECWWPLDVIKFALSDFEWSRWKPKRELFRKEVVGE